MLQAFWSALCSVCSQEQLYSLAFLSHLTTYWCAGGLLVVLDLTRPTWAAKFRCQADKYPSREVISKVAWNVMSNQLTTHLLTFVAMYPVAMKRLSFSEELPGAATSVGYLFAFTLITEFMFFFSHRAMHSPFLYREIHKVHHEIKAPFGICAIYFHPLEHVLTALEGALPALLCGSHVSILIFWIFLGTLNVILHHSGYDFEPYWPDSIKPFKSMTQQHDYHHFATHTCFGVIGLADWIFGTDYGFEKHFTEWERTRSKMDAN
eukprot:TRINITY_DN126237_c0_g1_i1.p1 TRINITY_DN126237_c0_g1~~TRINITY_DN126237_c0_g1_i1.p1  ORF type:complete len:264 (+),score=15.66 TRINITY_DN126237_c0_g1_i1:79-870(+)